MCSSDLVSATGRTWLVALATMLAAACGGGRDSASSASSSSSSSPAASPATRAMPAHASTAGDNTSRPMYPIKTERNIRVRMRDGVELSTDVVRPDADGQFPVLIMRTPYGKDWSAGISGGPYEHEYYAQRGYVVVQQDSRGRFDSAGVFEPFVNEGHDGAASIEWAARLPFSDGRVATYGFSYQGLSQLYAAAEQPPSLVAIAPMMCCPDPYEGWFVEGGALRWPFVCFWAAQLAGQDVQAGPIPFDTGALPISEALGRRPPRWFSEWISHPKRDGFWDRRTPDLDRITVPSFTVLGWFDDFSSGTATLIDRLESEA